ncbi:lysylphosphatidylglycerol synthase domain-containing protein [Streptomyces sp. NPDC004393]
MTARTLAPGQPGEEIREASATAVLTPDTAPTAPGDGPAGADEKPSARRRFFPRALRTHLGTVAGAAILGVLLWRLGTGVFLDGLRRIDVPTLLAGLGIGMLTTVFSAWRWCRVARALDIRLPLGAAVADYYRALFLNAALPGGVLGDVHRAVRHGQSAGDVGRGVRAVVLERTAGQVALVAVGVPVLLTFPSPVLTQARHGVALSALAILGVLAVVAALRMGRAARPSRRSRALRATLAEARTALLARGSWPAVLLSSVVVLAGHLLMFLVAARAAGSHASPATLLPLALLALIAMGLPLNVGGWGPREGVTAWAFGAAGLGADMGLSVAVVYGVLSFVASLPGIVVLLARWYTGLRGPRATTTDAEPGRGAGSVELVESVEPTGSADVPGASEALKEPSAQGPERSPHALPALVPYAPYPRSPPGSRRSLLTWRQGRCVPSGALAPGRPLAAGSSEATKEKYGAKESASAASKCFPFSAEPSEGRPMTPDSV